MDKPFQETVWPIYMWYRKVIKIIKYCFLHYYLKKKFWTKFVLNVLHEELGS